jgi:hypothetical protein
MYYPTIGSPLFARYRRVAADGPSYGLLDAMHLLSGLRNVRAGAEDSDQGGSISPLRWLGRQIGLLDALNGLDMTAATASDGTDSADHIIGRGPYLAGKAAIPLDTDSEVQDGGKPQQDDSRHSIARQILVDPFVADAKAIWTGIRRGNSGIYHTLANTVGVVNELNDFLTKTTGIGTLSKDTSMQDVEDWLYQQAAYAAPPSDDAPSTIVDKVLAGVGEAPADVAQALVAVQGLGPKLGLAALGALSEVDKGPEAAAEGAAGGLLMGKAFDFLPKLSPAGRAALLASLGAADTAGHGGDASDVLSSAFTMGMLGKLSGPRKMTPAETRIEDLRNLLSEYRMARIGYELKKARYKYFAPTTEFKERLVRLNDTIGKKNEILGKQLEASEGRSIGRAPRFYFGPRNKNYRVGDWTRLDEFGNPIEIVDAKHGREDAKQRRGDKHAPLPTIYLPRQEIIRRTKELLRKNPRKYEFDNW